MSDQINKHPINKKSNLNPDKTTTDEQEAPNQEAVRDLQEATRDESETYDLEELSDEDLDSAGGGTTVVSAVLTVINSCGTTSGSCHATYK